MLALRRGKDAGALKLSLRVEEGAVAALQSQLHYQYQVITKAAFHPSRCDDADNSRDFPLIKLERLNLLSRFHLLAFCIGETR